MIATTAIRTRPSDQIPYVSLNAFLRGTCSYETWFTPLDPTLSRLCRSSVAVHIATFLVVWWVFPPLGAAFAGNFGILFGATIASFLVHLHVPLLLVAAFGLVMATVLWNATDNLSAAPPHWHHVAFFHVALAALELFLLGLAALAFSGTLAIWIIVTVVALVIRILVTIMIALMLLGALSAE